MLRLAVTRGAPAAVEASLGLDQSARRLIQRGLRNEGCDPEAADGRFGPRTERRPGAGRRLRRHPSAATRLPRPNFLPCLSLL